MRSGCTIADAQMPEGPFEEVAELTILIEAASSFHDLTASARCAQLEDGLGNLS
jgi:hypothetical protein